MDRVIVQFSADVDGVRLFGCYAIQSHMVTVWHPILGSRTQTFHDEVHSVDLENMLAELYLARRERLRSLANHGDANRHGHISSYLRDPQVGQCDQ